MKEIINRKKGMEELIHIKDRLESKVKDLQGDMVSLAKTTLKELKHIHKSLERQAYKLSNLTKEFQRLKLWLTSMNYKVHDNGNANKMMSSMFGLLLSD